MEPFSMMLMMGAGVGMQVAGSLIGADATSEGALKYNEAQTKQIGLEQQIEGKKQQMMELTSHRQSLQNLRDVQRTQAMALNTSVNQGAQFGSGIQGGLSQITSEGNTNELNLNQNLEIGRNIFGFNNEISQQKILMANAQKNMQQDQAFGSAMSSIGGSMVGGASAFGRLSSGWGNTPSGPNLWGTGLYPGAQTGSLY